MEKNKLSINKLLSSLDCKNNIEQIFDSNLKSGQASSTNDGGKSGSFFFFSQDKNFIVKTMKKSELKVILKMLPELDKIYGKRPSFIAPIIGAFHFKLEGFNDLTFMIMPNQTKLTNPENSFIMKFDLKGSMVGRRALSPNIRGRQKLLSISKNEILKDQDLLKVL
jgi:1-phosphatidylinositol-4-phosphate 5-kinase